MVNFMSPFRESKAKKELKDDAQVTVNEAKTVDGACYLELKVLSRSRRDGCWDFLGRYGYHYGDDVSRPLLPSELSENMRLHVGCNPGDADSIKEFAESILSIGDGKIGGKNDGHAEVEFPEDMLIPDSDDHVETIIKETYENWQQQLWDPTYFQDRAILAPTHKEVDKVNARIIQIAWMGINNIEAKIISGGKVGDVCFIPRMNISPSDKKMPFQLNRRQFPVSVCFAMTINKSQGQPLSKDDAQVTVNEAKTADGACYLELKAPSRSRRDDCWDFLDIYGYHYCDGISRPLLPSEISDLHEGNSQEFKVWKPNFESQEVEVHNLQAVVAHYLQSNGQHGGKKTIQLGVSRAGLGWLLATPNPRNFGAVIEILGAEVEDFIGHT
ncbi:ATP-dependent DNA helicase PIF1-like protein [Tanacetum coccineum]